MKFSVVTPNYNGDAFLEESILSVLKQKSNAIEIEYIIIDGGSTDRSSEIYKKYEKDIDILIVEEDTGPANAINKGLNLATGEIISWLNADDIYFPDAFSRVQKIINDNDSAKFCFGKCPIIDESGSEIRKPITLFKQMFFPISSRFVFQSINYVSQPSVFFNRKIFEKANRRLQEDMVAAWDYEFFLRLWGHGKGVYIKGDPIAAFRWHSTSISGQNFKVQFSEELDAAIKDAGQYSLQALIHHGVKWGIIGAYSCMSAFRKTRS